MNFNIITYNLYNLDNSYVINFDLYSYKFNDAMMCH